MPMEPVIFNMTWYDIIIPITLFVGVFLGIIIAAVCTNKKSDSDAYFKWLKEDRRRHEESRIILIKHGITPALYLPSLDIDDKELRKAMHVFGRKGYVFLDTENKIIGQTTVPIPIKKKTQKPQLHLVVSNK